MHASGCRYVHTFLSWPLMAAVGGLLFAAPLTHADPVGRLSPYAPRPTEAEPTGEGGYSPRVTPFRAVMPNETASTGLFMYDSALNVQSINTGGEVSILRGPSGGDLGTNRNGSGNITATWDEVVVGTNHYIRCAVTTTNGEAFIPAGTTMTTPQGGTQPAAFWSWRFGTVDPVNFQSWVTQVRLTRAQISFSQDRGQSFFSTFNHTSTIPNRNNWNPSSDDGELLASVGDGTNYILLQYTIEVTPTPGTLALLSGGLFTMSRRRRR